MLAFQRAGQAFKPRLGTATLIRALTALPTIRTQTPHRAIHNKVPGDNEAIKQVKPATGPVEGSTQGSASKAAEATGTTATVVGKAGGLTGDEFWRKVPIWKDVSVETFMSYRWTVG